MQAKTERQEEIIKKPLSDADIAWLRQHLSDNQEEYKRAFKGTRVIQKLN